MNLSRHAPIIVGLIINVIATGYAIFNPAMGTQLFTLYGISTGALYGYANQKLSRSDDSGDDE
jgi:hypothetical protein